MGDGQLTAALRLGVDGLVAEDAGDPFDRSQGQVEEPARLLAPMTTGHGPYAQLVAAGHAEAAVAARGAPADRARLQHYGLDPVVSRQVQGGGQAGEASADDRHLGLEVALQGRQRRAGPRGVAPEAGDLIQIIGGVVVEGHS